MRDWSYEISDDTSGYSTRNEVIARALPWDGTALWIGKEVQHEPKVYGVFCFIRLPVGELCSAQQRSEEIEVSNKERRFDDGSR